MNKLITYGCSFTYGEGLSDCWNIKTKKAGDKPSKYAWPHLLSKKLNVSYDNRGKPGTSNKFICNSILNTKFDTNDLVVILWTFFNRTCILENQNMPLRIINSDVENYDISARQRNFSKEWFKTFYYTYDTLFENYLKINYTNAHLNNQNVKVCNFILDRNLNFEIPIWNNVDCVPIHLDYDLPLAMDNKHPGIQAQGNIADKIYYTVNKYIKENQ